MTTRTAVLALVAVVLLAGCFGGSGGTPTEEPTPTGTPLPQAPGVGAETIENVTAMLEAYRGSMSNVGFVAEARLNDGNVTYAYGADGSRLVERQDGSEAIWDDGDVAYERTAEGSEVSYERLPDGVELDTLLQTSQLRERLTSARYERDGTTPCADTTCVVMTADGSTGGTLEGFTAELHIDRTGVIHSLEANWTRVRDDQSFEFRYAVEEIPRSSIERPDWVDEAMNSTG
jgi:hypothetical protein